MLRYASLGLQHDREVVMEAIKQNGYALEYASEELKGDKEVVMEALYTYINTHINIILFI